MENQGFPRVSSRELYSNTQGTPTHARHNSVTSQDGGSVVYFMACESFVKIGVTTNIKDRLSTIRTSSPFPVECIGTVPGNAELEGRLHSRFQPHRARAEWFCNKGSVAAFIKQVVVKRGGYQRRALDKWLAAAVCKPCGGMIYNTEVPVQPGVPVAFPVSVCRSCGNTITL